MNEKDPARAAVALRRHQWAEIVSGWQLYSAVVTPDRQDARWRGAMPGLCQIVSRRLRQEAGDLVTIDGGRESWQGVALWAMTCMGSRPVGTSALDAIVAQIQFDKSELEAA